MHGAGVDEPLAWYEGASVSSASRRYLHADHQGSIIATSNAAGAKQDLGSYDAYGVTTAPSTWRFQYTGQAAIPQLGLYYYKARFYNPALGRFMQTDPIGYDDDVNLYAYVGSDPLNKTDPSGKCPACKIGLDFALDAAEQYLTTGDVDWGAAATGAVLNALNPAKTLQRVARLSDAVRTGTRIGRAPIHGKPQITRKVGKETQHRPTMQRVATEESARSDAVSVHQNQTIGTVTDGGVKSNLRPDIQTVRSDGNIDVTEVLSPNQDQAATTAKYKDALGDRAGRIQCIAPDKCNL